MLQMVDSSSNRFRPSPDVVFRNVGEEAVLVPLRQNVGNLDWVYTLSPVAARVWQLLDGERPLPDIVAAICDEFEVEPHEAEGDVAELVTSLREAGLVVEAE
jgi:Coenzyme PQQ synthesis protein D (PqqD)